MDRIDSGEQGTKNGFVSDKRDRIKPRILAKRQSYGFNDLGRTEVATHGVYCDASGLAGSGAHRVDAIRKGA